jgi:hypothetical protein
MNYPRRWQDSSFEFKSMFVFFGAIMLLMMLGPAPAWTLLVHVPR